MSNWDPAVDIPFRQKRIWLAVFFAPLPFGLASILLEECLGQSFWPIFWTVCVASPALCLGAMFCTRTTISNKLTMMLFFSMAVVVHHALLVLMLAAISVFLDPFAHIQ